MNSLFNVLAILESGVKKRWSILCEKFSVRGQPGLINFRLGLKRVECLLISCTNIKCFLLYFRETDRRS